MDKIFMVGAKEHIKSGRRSFETRADALCRRYAEALIRVIDDSYLGEHGRFSREDAHALVQVYERLVEFVGDNDDLSGVLASPLLDKGEVAGALVDINQKLMAETSISLPSSVRQLSDRFLRVVVEGGRGPKLGSIVAALRIAIDRKFRAVPVVVSSAFELDSQERGEIESMLRRTTPSDVQCSWVVEPELLGGVSFRVGDAVIDGSLRESVRQLGRTLVLAS